MQIRRCKAFVPHVEAQSAFGERTVNESYTRAPDAQQGPGVLPAYTRRRLVDRVEFRKETNGVLRSGKRMSVAHSATVGYQTGTPSSFNL